MAKTIFKTSEKSNFILNMTEEQYSSIASKALCVMCFIIPLFTIPAEYIKDTGPSIVSAGLAISGVVCMILALIAAIKKFIDRKMLFPIAAFGAMLLWGVVSLINSYNVTISFYGFNGRGEGLLALIFYFAFFISALTIKTEKALNTFLGGIIASGVLNSVWGLLQVFIPSMPSNYQHIISVRNNVNAASGLAQSPIFLAMFLSLALTAAVVGFVMSNSKKKRIICLACSILFSFVMILTYSLVGMFGILFSIISAVAAVILSGAPKSRLSAIAGIVLSAALAITLVITGVAGKNNSYKLYDGSLMWQDSFIRLSSSGLYNSKSFDIESTSDVYYFLNNKTIDIIERMPLTGTGPEQLVYPQLYSSYVIEENQGTFDKVYNEYLYTAATRGIISLIALIAVLISVIYISYKKLKTNKKNYTTVSFFLITVCGVLIFIIGCSNISFSPVFWGAAGASCAASMPVNKEKSHPKKKK